MNGTHTPSLARSPKGQFDSQAAVRALKAGDEEALVAVLMTTKWGKVGYQAQVTGSCAVTHSLP